MTGLNVALLTGRNSLLTNQQKLAIGGNNVANAGSLTYHKQEASVGPSTPLTTISGQYGTGSNVERVIRQFDQTLENNLRFAMRQDSYNETYADQLELVESTFAYGSESPLTLAVSDFADSWQSLASEPEAEQVRQTLIEQGKVVADQFNLMRTQLVDLQDAVASSSTAGTLPQQVDQVNSLSESIADLNKRISDLENRLFQPQDANDLRDQRDAMVLELGKLVEISVSEQADSSYTITLDGADLVAGNSYNTIQADLTGGVLSLEWTASGTTISQTSSSTQALMDSHTYIGSLITDLDTYATELASTLNAAHATGFDLNGLAGGDLFDASTPGNLQFLITDPDDLAASSVAGSVGDSGNARAVWSAMNTGVAGLGGDSLMNHADRMTDTIAIDVATAKSLHEGSSASVEMYQEAISSVSGVNVDEEMMSMLEIQRAYQASAKFVSIVDEMLSSVLQMI